MCDLWGFDDAICRYLQLFQSQMARARTLALKAQRNGQALAPLPSVGWSASAICQEEAFELWTLGAWCCAWLFGSWCSLGHSWLSILSLKGFAIVEEGSGSQDPTHGSFHALCHVVALDSSRLGGLEDALDMRGLREHGINAIVNVALSGCMYLLKSIA